MTVHIRPKRRKGDGWEVYPACCQRGDNLRLTVARSQVTCRKCLAIIGKIPWDSVTPIARKGPRGPRKRRLPRGVAA